VVEQHDPGDAATRPPALRLAEQAIALDPEQDQARADILTLLVHSGDLDEALRRTQEWRQPHLITYLVEVVEKHAPQRLAELVDHVPAMPGNVSALQAYGLGPQALSPAVWIQLITQEADTTGGPDVLLGRLVAALDPETATAVVVAIAQNTPDRLTQFLRGLPADHDATAYLYPAAYHVLRTSDRPSPRDATPESLAICERIMQLPAPADPHWYTWAHASAIIFAYHLGDLDRATELIDRSLHLAEQNPAIYFNATCVYAGGRRDAARALDLLRRAVRAGFHDVETIRTDDDLVLLHDHPEFNAILAEARAADTSPPAEGA
jgi:tetratricopeptide (TPR) repeat protein